MRQAALTGGGSGATAPQVQGAGLADSAAVGNPVLVGGVDGLGVVQELPVTDEGAVTGNQAVIIGGNDGGAGGVTRRLGVRSGGAIITVAKGNSSDAFPDVNVGTLADTTTVFCSLLSALQIFNGTTWDRARSAGAAGVFSVGGAAAQGATTSGNPVLIGGNRFSGSTVNKISVSDNGNIGLGDAITMGDGEQNTGIKLFSPADNATFKLMVTPFVFDGLSWERPRTPNVFKSAVAIATGTTALWTPALGKKFRLMRYKMSITANANATAAGVITFSLLDSAANMGMDHSAFIPIAASARNNGEPTYESGWIDLGNGFLSATTNNVLNLSFTAAGFAGAVRVIMCGTEE